MEPQVIDNKICGSSPLARVNLLEAFKERVLALGAASSHKFWRGVHSDHASRLAAVLAMALELGHQQMR